MPDSPAVPMTTARAKAWETRRRLYGPAGHRGMGIAYRRPRSRREDLALRLIARLHEQEVLSEGQCRKALDMDRIEFRVMCDTFAAEAPDA